jgi:hypothetical protein
MHHRHLDSGIPEALEVIVQANLFTSAGRSPYTIENNPYIEMVLRQISSQPGGGPAMALCAALAKGFAVRADRVLDAPRVNGFGPNGRRGRLP